MSDFEKLQEALDNSGDDSYMNSLNRSLALVLDEFYNALTAVAVSAASGDGMPALFKVYVSWVFFLLRFDFEFLFLFLFLFLLLFCWSGAVSVLVLVLVLIWF